jgi:4-hydroxybenzoate polyprenyltransferase
VKANPIGRWFARFQCPHCKKFLQWSALTNTLGIGGSLLFFIAAYAAVMGQQPWTRLFAAVAALFWVVALALSYALRRITKG